LICQTVISFCNTAVSVSRLSILNSRTVIANYNTCSANLKMLLKNIYTRKMIVHKTANKTKSIFRTVFSEK